MFAYIQLRLPDGEVTETWRYVSGPQGEAVKDLLRDLPNAISLRLYRDGSSVRNGEEPLLKWRDSDG